MYKIDDLVEVLPIVIPEHLICTYDTTMQAMQGDVYRVALAHRDTVLLWNGSRWAGPFKNEWVVLVEKSQ